ncbi:MAG: hypothetical protein WA584_12965 [Pyrinomonadaceae bacterium]
MNYSQKIARAFEIAGYLLLIPAGFGVFAASMLIKDAPWFTFLIYAIFLFGFVLLVGYFKHSRGRLEEKRVRALWIASAVYNGVLLLPVLGIALITVKDFLNGYASYDNWTSIGFVLAVISGYATTIVLSIKAYQFEKNNQKYL